jgi:hypothetical protein
MIRLFELGKEVGIDRKYCNAPDIDPKSTPLTVFVRSFRCDLDFASCPWAIAPGP